MSLKGSYLVPIERFNIFISRYKAGTTVKISRAGQADGKIRCKHIGEGGRAANLRYHKPAF